MNAFAYTSAGTPVQRKGPSVTSLLRPVTSTTESIPPYSDILQRHCDKILLNMEAEATASLAKANAARRLAMKNRKEGAARIQAKAQEKEAGAGSSAYPEDAQGAAAATALAELATPPPHSIPTGEMIPVSSQAPNPSLPSELLPVYLPGVAPALLTEAAKRAKRSEKRRRDYLNLQKPGRKRPINEDELFPQQRDRVSSDESDAGRENSDVESDKRQGDKNAAGNGNEGGIETPRCNTAPPFVWRTGVTCFSPLPIAEAEEESLRRREVSPINDSALRSLMKDTGVRVHELPQTVEYQRVIRMNRVQQRHWRPRKDWDMRLAASSPPAVHPESHQRAHRQSDVSEADASSTAQSLTASQFPRGFLLNESGSPKPTVPQISFSGVEHQKVPRLNLALALHTAALLDATDAPEKLPSSRRTLLKQESASEEQSECPRSSPLQDGAVTRGLPVPLLRRRGKSPREHEQVSEVAENGDDGSHTSPASPQRQYRSEDRHSVTRDSLRDYDDEEDGDEDIEALRSQFAAFLAGPPRAREVEDAVRTVDAKPFVLPPTFVKYSLAGAHGSMLAGPTVGLSSSFDAADLSTPDGAATVKIVWGSSAASAAPSAVARSAPVRLVVELLFRPTKHYFDAAHLYSLFEPHRRCILDLEAGNRGGKFLAIYSTSELQCLKAIAAMINKVRRGESYLLEDVFCATSPHVPSAELLESPRDEDLEMDPLRRNHPLDVAKALREHKLDGDVDNDEKLARDESEEAPDPMAWFRKFAVVIEEKVVNHHAPGALEQFKAMVERKRRKEEQKKKKKRKSVLQLQAEAAVTSGLVTEASLAFDTTLAGAVPEEDVPDEVPNLFIAEGDEVEGLEDLLALQKLREEEEEKARRKSITAGGGPASEGAEGGAPMDASAGDGEDGAKPISTFARREMADQELREALSTGMSIMELTIRSKYSPDELRRMKAREAMKKPLTKRQLARLEKAQQRAVLSMKEFRESAGDGLEDEFDVSSVATTSAVAPSTAHKPRCKRYKARNAKALHAKRRKRLADAGKGNDGADPGDAAATSHADDGGANAESQLQESNAEEAADVRSTGSGTLAPVQIGFAPNTTDPATQDPVLEADDNDALESFNEFLQQYATCEKIAIIAPLTQFSDPSIPPTPNAESDAEDLIFLLHQMDYDIVIMAPPERLLRPDHDATEEDIALYEKQVEFQRKRWFLKPTAENIVEVVEALLQQNQGGRYCCVALFLITRGFVGDFKPKFDAPAARSDKLIALTLDTDLSNMNAENVLLPRELLRRTKANTGKVPLIFIDTFPLVDLPHADVYGTYVNAVANAAARQGPSGMGNPTPPPARLPAPAFFLLSAQPEDGGHELVCQYPMRAGGIATYYIKRAFEGRACPPNSLVMTMSNLIWYLSTKLQSRACRVNHNAIVPKAYSSLKPYFDLSLVYDSAYELHRTLATAHVLEITTPARINVRVRVRLDQTQYVTESDHFQSSLDLWTHQLKKDLHKLLYPKKESVVVGQLQVGARSKQKGSAPPLKPRAEKALRARILFCRPLASSLFLEYPDSPEMLLDDKRFRAVEKDMAKVNEKCQTIQRWTSHGFIFANGLHLLSNSAAAAGGSNQSPSPRILASARVLRPAELVRRRSSVAPTFDPYFFNKCDLNLTLMAQYVDQKIPDSIPLTMFPHFSAGYVKLQFNGVRKRAQQDFAMNYFISGCQRSTVPGTTPVSLFKRPTMLWGEIDVVIGATRRDLRKVDRLLRQQLLATRTVGEAIALDSFCQDLFEPKEHAAALLLQKMIRGHTVRTVLREQRAITGSERELRAATRFDEATKREQMLSAFFVRARFMLESDEDRMRYEGELCERDERGYLVDEARKLLLDTFKRLQLRLLAEAALESSPLLEMIVRMNVRVKERFEFAWIVALEWFFSGAAWDRYYLELDCYQEVLRVRNLVRDSHLLEQYQFGYLMPSPQPPSTFLDSGHSIVRSIIEERQRAQRRKQKEKELQDELDRVVAERAAAAAAAARELSEKEEQMSAGHVL